MSTAERSQDAGYRQHTHARSTGTTVVLYQAADAGIEDDPATPWALVCEEHGGCCCFETMRDARRFLSAPEEWCPTCQNGD